MSTSIDCASDLSASELIASLEQFGIGCALFGPGQQLEVYNQTLKEHGEFGNEVSIGNLSPADLEWMNPSNAKDRLNKGRQINWQHADLAGSSRMVISRDISDHRSQAG